MKSRFTTVDLRAAISDLGSRLMGLRVVNIYDINNKTYLIRLQGTDQKEMLLIESGIRIHVTNFDWPKSSMPSNFSMKLRKHLKSRRLNQLHQLGMDRVVDMQFGSDEAAYHLIVELYDRGNIILTDSDYVILNLLRTRTDSEDVRFAVRETFPLETAKRPEPLPESNRLKEMLAAAKPGDPIRKILNPHFVFGPAVIEHCLLRQGIPSGARLDKELSTEDLPRLLSALREAEDLMEQSGQSQCKGYIIQKKEKKPMAVEGSEDVELLTYTEYHPFLYEQHKSSPYIELDSFNKAVDEFYSKLEGQKADMKVLQQEKDALKKLENVKKDHEKRLDQLAKAQEVDKRKGELIEMNLPLVDQAIKVVCSAIANQIDWTEIENIIHEAQAQQDPVASAIKSLKLDMNHITMILRDPYEDKQEEEDIPEESVKKQKKKDKANHVDIDLGLSAYANARRFYEQKKFSKKKEQRTVDASQKAIKSAERKTKQALKDVATVASINKTRKTYWFEKFYWFISSENYLIIAGRDQQQNEIVVKKYLSPGDIYVHADLHGASSVIVKNPSGGPVPPVTLQEAGVMAICYSVAWDAKVVTSAWWVNHEQVSKTAPTGEYLTTGSFMIRGKKNYLPPAQLMMGFGFVFKVEDSCVWRHKDERRVRGVEEDEMSVADSSTVDGSVDADEEIPLQGDEDDDSDEESENKRAEETGECDEPAMTVEDIEEAEEDNGDEANQDEEEEKPQVAEGSSSSDEDVAYPDTAIQLHHVQGAKLEPERSRGSSVLSTGSHHSNEGETEWKVYLGDDQPVVLGSNKESNKQKPKQYLSAKQKRQLKKQKKKPNVDGSNGDEEPRTTQEAETAEVISEDATRTPSLKDEEEEADEEEEEDGQNQEALASQKPQQLKRGRKNKLKKIKQKYKDQDEEERRLKMEILASAGVPRELKGKKAKQARKQQLLEEKHQQMKQKQQQQQRRKQQALQGQWHQGRGGGSEGDDAGHQLEGKMEDLAVTDQKDEDIVQPVGFKHAWKSKRNPVGEDDAAEASDEDRETALKEEQSQLMKESSNIVDSLTALPDAEDILMFALPVCAPYSVMHNYKFKVKLTPGTGKRGKAAKTALSMFQFSKETTSREKDLFKSVKDTDLSRNLPGKVKVSAPNLQKAKSKAKKK